MVNSKVIASLLLPAAHAAVSVGTIGTITKQEVVQKLDSGSELVALYSSPSYVDPIYVLSLHGDQYYSQGYDAGILLGKQVNENYQVILNIFRF